MTINTEAILGTAAMMEAAPDRLFDMSEYGRPECGTPGCIAGWAIVYGDRKNEPLSYLRACTILGLNVDQADDLFVPEEEDACYRADTVTFDGASDDPRFISKDRAVAQLRHLAATGEVDWSKTL